MRDYYKNILRLHLENCIAAPSGCQTEGNGRKLGVSAKYKNTEIQKYKGGYKYYDNKFNGKRKQYDKGAKRYMH